MFLVPFILNTVPPILQCIYMYIHVHGVLTSGQCAVLHVPGVHCELGTSATCFTTFVRHPFKIVDIVVVFWSVTPFAILEAS